MPSPKGPTMKIMAPKFFARVTTEADGKHGHISLYDTIGDGSFWSPGVGPKQISAKLDELREAGAKHLHVHVSSPGGDVFAAAAIHSLIAGWKDGDRNIHVEGLAASGASLVAMAGTKVHMGKAGMLMIHNPRGYASGEAVDLRKQADKLDAIAGVMAGCYAQGSEKTEAECRKLMDAETWLNAEQAVAEGFADDIEDKPIDPEEDEGDEEDDENEEMADRSQTIAAILATFKHAPSEITALVGNTFTAVERPDPVVAPEVEALKARVAELEKAPVAKPEVVVVPDPSAESITSVLKATGEKTIGDALAKIAGLTEAAKRTDELSAEVAKKTEELAKVATEKTQAEISALLDAASKDGRLTPAHRAELIAPEAPAFARDVAQLKVHLGALPKIVRTVDDPGPRAIPTDDSVVSLTDLEKKVAAGQHVDAAHVAIFKAGGSEALDKVLKAEAIARREAKKK